MNIKLLTAFLTVGAVVYLTVPIAKHPSWTEADNVLNTPSTATYGLLADFSYILRYKKLETVTYDHEVTQMFNARCSDMKKLANQYVSQEDFEKNCKSAKAAHYGLVIVYVLYLGTAFYHSHAPKDKRNAHPFYFHMIFLLISWSLLLTLAIAHMPLELQKQGGGTVKAKWNPATLGVLISALIIQAVDLVMTIYSYFKGNDYEPFSMFNADMYGYASAM